MKKFNFKLETVLKVRKHREMVQQQVFAKAARKKMQLEQQQTTAKEAIVSYSGFGDRQTAMRTMHFAFIEDKQQQVFRLGQHIKKAETEMEKERNILLTAVTKTKVLENLKSKHKMLFVKELDREEQKEMNEIATNRFVRE